jgi:hypothetical protein
MPPPTQFELSVEPRVALFAVPLKLRFVKKQRRVIDPEIHAVAIAKLGILGTRPGGIAVEHRANQCQVIGYLGEGVRPSPPAAAMDRRSAYRGQRWRASQGTRW